MGHRPVAPVKIGYESVYLYLTLCPLTGEGFAAFLPRLDSEQFNWLIEQVQACLTQKSLFIADGATAHKAEAFDATKLVFVRLPAACPELNPVERFFREVRRQLKSRVFETLEQAQQGVQCAVESLADKVVSITAFPYLKNAPNQI